MSSTISDIYSSYLSQSSLGSASTSALTTKLEQADSSEATDEELMDACKEFETYLVEQVLKQVEDSIPKSDEEEDNDYLEYFGDMMTQEYASAITDQGTLGIAQTLYEAMKNNSSALNLKTVETSETTEDTTVEETAAVSGQNL